MKKVHETGFVIIGGVKQWIRTIGDDINNPILLYVHGGPGMSTSAISNFYNSDLEKHFIVVHWDQRAAANSYFGKIDKSTMVIKQYVEDTIEVTEYLTKKFKKNKVFIIGHSWGTVLATYAIKERPELYYAYIGMGQVANQEKSEAIAYDFALEECKKAKDKKGIAELEKIGPAVGAIHSSNDWIAVQRKYVFKYKGMFHDPKLNFIKSSLKCFLKDKDYGIKGFYKFVKCQKPNVEVVWPTQLSKVNFFNVESEFQIPVYIFQGAYDHITCTQVAKEYFDFLKAPLKRFYLFEESGHCVSFEEPKKFYNIIVNEILNESYKTNMCEV